jgi:hypothetical protein
LQDAPEEDSDISESLELLFSENPLDQVKACKSIADILSLPPSLPEQVYSQAMTPELEAARTLWHNIFDEVAADQSTPSSSSDWTSRSDATFSGEEDEQVHTTLATGPWNKPSPQPLADG